MGKTLAFLSQLLPILVLPILLASLTLVSSIRLESDGGYSGLVFKISEDVPEDLCDDILQRMQVRPYDFYHHMRVQYSMDDCLNSDYYIDTDAKKSYWPKSRLIIKIHNFYL